MLSKVFIGVFCVIIMRTSICVGIDIKGERIHGNNKCELRLNECKLQMEIPGKTGEKGERGLRGPDGDRGSIGLTGPQGHDSEFHEICAERLKPEFLPQAGENLNIIGTYDRPSSTPCYALRHEEKGIIWVNPYNVFQVNCPKDSNLTCLIDASPKNEKYIENNAFHSPAVQRTPFWLSNYYSEMDKTQRFDLFEFYNAITPIQIDWLRKNTNKTIMRIRIHCKNFKVDSSNETALHLLSWNDVIIRPYVSDTSPLSYTIDESAHGCKEDAPKTEWRFTDIIIQGDNKRLPIIDFHIRDTRTEHQSFFFELFELCFG